MGTQLVKNISISNNSVSSSSYIRIQFSISTVSILKTVQFQIIKFGISSQFKCKYSLIMKNISIAIRKYWAIL